MDFEEPVLYGSPWRICWNVNLALVRDPKILLLDEPTSNLDPGAQKNLAAVVKHVNRECGISVIFVSHDVNLIAKYADRILYITQGKHTMGTVDEVLKSDVLTRLYGVPVEVMKLGTKIMVAVSSSTPICIHEESSEEVYTIWNIIELSAGILIVLLIGYKMLPFDSFDPIGAQAAGYPVRFISIAFLLILAIATAEAIQIVGALLVFVLMTIPAATTRFLTHSVSRMILYASILALVGVWAGLTLGYYTGAPVSFFIAAVEGLLYFMAWGVASFKQHMRPQEIY